MGWFAAFPALGLALLHGALAAFEYAQGMSFRGDPPRDIWDNLWHSIPQADLQHHFWSSFWALHTQPPLFSLWGWVWLRLCGERNFPGSLQLGYVILGSAAVALTYRLALALTRSPRWALAAGLLMAFNPALLYFEAFMLYEVPVLFLALASAWQLWRGLAERRPRWLVGFIVTLNALVLTRSLYHLVFLTAALTFAWPLWRALAPRRRWALAVLALAAPALWCGKNLAQYGFFGSSSWFGMGWFRCVSRQYTYWELRELGQAGVIPEYAWKLSPYQHRPHEYEIYGFNRRSAVPLVSRDDLQNVNMPAISAAYARAAKILIRHDPWRYVRAVHAGYGKFCSPLSRFEYLEGHRRRHVFWEPLYAVGLYGKWVTDAVHDFTGIQLGSLFYLYFPVLMIGGIAWTAAGWRRLSRLAGAGGKVGGEKWARPALVAYFVYLCLYVAAVGCLFEYGENDRFRFATEPFTLLPALILLQECWGRWGRRACARLRPGRGFFHRSRVR